MNAGDETLADQLQVPPAEALGEQRWVEGVVALNPPMPLRIIGANAELLVVHPDGTAAWGQGLDPDFAATTAARRFLEAFTEDLRLLRQAPALLAMLRKHEWVIDWSRGVRRCLECGGVPPGCEDMPQGTFDDLPEGHQAGCEIDALLRR